MKNLITSQKDKIHTMEKLIKEYEAVYRDYKETSNAYLNINPVYNEEDFQKVYIQIKGGYYLDNSYWAIPELNRIILRNFMILKSVYKDYDVYLMVAQEHRNLIKFSEDALRILTNYGCKLIFSDNMANNLHKKDKEGNDIYSLRWALHKNNNVYVNFEDISLVCNGEDIKEVRFETRIETHPKVIENNFSNNKDPLYKRLIDSLVNLICADFPVDKNIILYEVQIASCLCIILNIEDYELENLLKELLSKLHIKDKYVVEEIIELIEEYQSYTFIWNKDDITENSLIQKASKHINTRKKLEHKKTD